MSQIPYQARAVQVKPQPNVYTVLVIVAVLAVGITIGVALYFLLASQPNGCGLSFGDLFGKAVVPGGGR
jgi:hypothetical protein